MKKQFALLGFIYVCLSFGLVGCSIVSTNDFSDVGKMSDNQTTKIAIKNNYFQDRR